MELLIGLKNLRIAFVVVYDLARNIIILYFHVRIVQRQQTIDPLPRLVKILNSHLQLVAVDVFGYVV
jgi:peptidoglycan/xylan/chitin deacetylase (PgdA/CDA1 family)